MRLSPREHVLRAYFTLGVLSALGGIFGQAWSYFLFFEQRRAWPAAARFPPRRSSGKAGPPNREYRIARLKVGVKERPALSDGGGKSPLAGHRVG